MRTPWKQIGLAVIFSVLLFGLYVAAYFTLVEGGVQEDASGQWVVIPTYRFCGKVSVSLFDPLYQVDRQLRTEHWSEPTVVRRMFSSRRDAATLRGDAER